MKLALHEVRMVPVADIKADPSNPNVMTEEQMEGLRESMKRFGYLDPVIVDQNMTMADGEHRLAVYREFGQEKVPCYIVKLKDDAERRLLRQTMNKLRGQHNLQKDADELFAIYKADRLSELTKLLSTDMNAYLRILSRTHQVPWIPEVNTGLVDIKERVKHSEVWMMGHHRLVCGDSRDSETIKMATAGKEVDLLLTDPPYGIGVVEEHEEYTGSGSERPVGTLRSPAANKPLARFRTLRENRSHDRGIGTIAGTRASDGLRLGRLKAHGRTRSVHGISLGESTRKKIVYPKVYRKVEGDYVPFDPQPFLAYGKTKILFGGNHYAHLLPESHHWIVWDKKPDSAHDTESTTFSEVELAWTNIKRRSSRMYRFHWAGMTREGDRKEELDTRIHPTQKPVGLMAMILLDYSKEGDTVLDPFAGSGSTLIACEKLNRPSFHVEIDPYYCTLILDRWEKFTGRKAERLASYGKE